VPEEDKVARIETLHSETHRQVRVRTRAGLTCSDDRPFVPVVASEFPKLAVHYPILLAKSEENGAFFAGAMLGIEAGEDLLHTDSRSGAFYRPLDQRRGPFYTIGDDLAIDMDHPLVGLDDGELLFDTGRQPTSFLRGVQSVVTKLQYGLEETSKFIETLLALRLVEPVDISLRFDDGRQHRLDGLYTVSSDRLHALEDADVLRLFRDGHLRLAYLMISSLEQIPVLARLHNQRLPLGA
jgi:hypothetical protein